MSFGFSYFIHNLEKLKEEWDLVDPKEIESFDFSNLLIDMIEQINIYSKNNDFQGFLKVYDNLLYIMTIRLVKEKKNDRALELINQSSFLVDEGLARDNTVLAYSYYMLSIIFCEVVHPIHLDSYLEGINFLERSISLFQELSRLKNVSDFQKILKTYKRVYNSALSDLIHPIILDHISNQDVEKLSFESIKEEIVSKLDLKEEELNEELLVTTIFNIPMSHFNRNERSLDPVYYRGITALYKVILPNFISKIDSPELISPTLQSLSLMIYVLLKTKGIPFEDRLNDNIYFHEWIINTPIVENLPSILLASLKSLSEVYKFKGDIAKSNDFLYKSLTYEISNPFTVSSLYFSLIHNHVLEKDYLKALQLYGKYKSLFSENENHIIQSQIEFASALILTEKKDSRSRIKAEDIIKDLVTNNMLQSDHRSLALKHLIELRLIELEIYGDKEILDEIMGYIDAFEKQAEEDEEITLRIEALLLKGKINTINGDLALTKSQYEKASDLADQHGLGLLFKEIEHEKTRLDEKYEEWEKIIIENPSFVEKIKKLQVMEYMKKAQRMMGDIDR